MRRDQANVVGSVLLMTTSTQQQHHEMTTRLSEAIDVVDRYRVTGRVTRNKTGDEADLIGQSVPIQVFGLSDGQLFVLQALDARVRCLVLLCFRGPVGRRTLEKLHATAGQQGVLPAAAAAQVCAACHAGSTVWYGRNVMRDQSSFNCSGFTMQRVSVSIST